jgi:hypothetical protein
MTQVLHLSLQEMTPIRPQQMVPHLDLRIRITMEIKMAMVISQFQSQQILMSQSLSLPLTSTPTVMQRISATL